MAAGERGGGKGTSMNRGVRSTMGTAFPGNNMGASGSSRMKAPFDAPAAAGRGDIKTTIYVDGMSAAPARTATAGQVSPPIGRTQAVGTRRFKNPK